MRMGVSESYVEARLYQGSLESTDERVKRSVRTYELTRICRPSDILLVSREILISERSECLITS